MCLRPQVFAVADANELDLEEAAAAEPEALLASRREADAEQAQQLAADACAAVEGLRQRILAAAEAYAQRHTRLLPEEELRISQVCWQEAGGRVGGRAEQVCGRSRIGQQGLRQCILAMRSIQLHCDYRLHLHLHP